IHAIVGKVSFSDENIYNNAKELLDTIIKLKPSSAKGEYVTSVFMSSTMSPSINVDSSSI
ncbi:MAG: 50S ribosomal protein L1, partial [Flavobacteriales bacterium]